MAINDPGAGGGKSGLPTASNYALDKPYDVGWPLTAAGLKRINDMFTLLFKNLTKTTAAVAGVGTGNVTGPTVATDGDIAVFDGATGTKIRDGGAIVSIQKAVLTLTGTLYKTLNSVPQQVIAAPGAGNQIVIHDWMLEQDLDATSVAYSGPTTISLQFAGVAVDVTTGISTTNPGSGTRYVRWVGGPATQNSLGNGVSVANTALNIRSSGDLTGGSNLGNNQLQVTVYYSITTKLA